MKIKYTWTLMYGDADLYKDKELVLIDPAEIALFDFISTIPFNHYQCEGFLLDIETAIKIGELINNLEDDDEWKEWNAPTFENFKNNDEYIEHLEDYMIADENDDIETSYCKYISMSLSEITSDWDYVSNDVVCNGMHYADIQDFKREDITDEVSFEELVEYLIKVYDLSREKIKNDCRKARGLNNEY